MGTVNFYIYLFFIYKCLNEINCSKKETWPSSLDAMCLLLELELLIITLLIP